MLDAFVVDTAWLEEHLQTPGLIVVDTRPPPFYVQGHLPGAVSLASMFLPVGASGPNSEAIAKRLGEVGISPASDVVVYDEGDGITAARVVWILRFMRHNNAAILNGGVTLWAHEGRPLEYHRPAIQAQSYPAPTIDRTVLSNIDEVSADIGSPDVIILDVRTPAEYLGLQRTAARNGHIPGAVNVDMHATLTAPDGVQRWLPDDELRNLYETAGATSDKEIVVHCHSGHRSSASFLQLLKLGYPRVRNYAAGWQEWGNRPDTPIEEG